MADQRLGDRPVAEPGHQGIDGGLGLAHFDVDGLVDLRTGDFDLRQTAHLDIDATIATLKLDESIHFGYHRGVFAADAHLHGYLQLGTNDWNFHAYVDGDVSLSAGKGQFHIAGHGEIGAGVVVAGVNPGDISLGFDFDDHGFGVNALGRDIKVKW